MGKWVDPEEKYDIIFEPKQKRSVQGQSNHKTYPFFNDPGFDGSVVFHDECIGYGKSRADTLPGLPGGKKQVEETVKMILRDGTTCIKDLNNCKLTILLLFSSCGDLQDLFPIHGSGHVYDRHSLFTILWKIPIFILKYF